MPVDLSKERGPFTRMESLILSGLASGAVAPMARLEATLAANGSRSLDMQPMVKVVISRLRSKLTHHAIVCMRGVGYQLAVKPEEPSPPPPTTTDPSEFRQ